METQSILLMSVSLPKLASKAAKQKLRAGTINFGAAAFNPTRI
jgi:hypothetical protein